MTGKDVLVGFSGGVDSFYTCHLLKEKGYKVYPVLFRFSGKENLEKAKYYAEKLGLKLSIIDYRELFYEKVIKPFIEYYRNGLTPNPCVVCNRDMKIKMLYNLSEELGIKNIATGHYARTEFSEDFQKKLIFRGVEKGKEQSYFLATILPEFIEKLIFPLGEFTKKEVIEKAKALGYQFLSESQDICFLEDDIETFLSRYIKPKKGKFVLTSGEEVGSFSAIFKYTVGQRRGLGISYKYPLYVLSILPEKNVIVVGSKDELQKNSLYIKDIVLHVPYGEIDWNCVDIQIRYRGKIARIERIEVLKNGIFFVKLHASLDAPTPGQVCAFYFKDTLLGGGEITTLERG
ncbi:tRNA 2-thiouridine(34) synthase MnmA [Desulfurobacterium atlanticum]|uniref:tRNA-uridine 2-sulfurtransferase n=1 Tax=Desulfurobacterium atlanticum TaxID=240169 RepID=A0A238YKF2_9BACT|nr:tRNA 2-thiouridine(34) synthase MnmA [Desulfurobacterium atlanticum]SNR71104.1 tRNA (5-methylaminomethyl-2-thiouridylate)-methyltransferase [Desulfurobacterium atlanticum]